MIDAYTQVVSILILNLKNCLLVVILDRVFHIRFNVATFTMILIIFRFDDSLSVSIVLLIVVETEDCIKRGPVT